MSDPVPSFVFRGLKSGSNVVCLYEKGPTERSLWSGGFNGEISVFNLNTKRLASSYSLHNNSILSLHSIDSTTFYSQCRDGLLKLWNPQSGQVIVEIPAGSLGFCRSVVGHLQNNLVSLTTGQDSNTLNIWDLHNKKILHSLSPKGDRKFGMCMATCLVPGDGSYVASAYEDGGLYFFDLRQPDTILFGLERFLKEPMLCFTLSDDLQSGSLGGATDTLYKFSLSIPESKIEILSSQQLSKPGIQGLQIRHDNKLLAVSCWDHRLRLYSWKKLSPLAILKFHQENVDAFQFSSFDNLVVTGSKDGKIALWNLY
eukprot:TRINITY_DN11125_c0_g1_i1.p1 TRINITY_DN11125_c0_g1~~TRINITY_DN11125_c0_g1_i1.p1  ORF type:complete len:365 (+),score=57.07 TRINITY_DN11125_c0_g1_i1:157-1095(+)